MRAEREQARRVKERALQMMRKSGLKIPVDWQA
jgi:hypothetical protein